MKGGKDEGQASSSHLGCSKSLPNLEEKAAHHGLHPCPTSPAQVGAESPGECANKKRKSPFSKSLFKGGTFCLSPQNFRFKLKSSKDSPNNKKLLDVGLSSLSRSSPKSSILSFNSILSSLPNNDPIYEEKAQRQISRHLWHLKMLIYGDDCCTEKILNDKNHALLMQTILNSGFLTTLVMKLEILNFEDRKTACLLLSNLFRRPVSEGPMVLYFEQNPKLMLHLLDGYHNPSSPVALSCGKILRECTHYEPLARQILESDSFYAMFQVLRGATFEVAADAFITLRSIVLGHKVQMASYLRSTENYSTFFTHISDLFTCNNYVTKISTLELLASMLIDRQFFDQMQEYARSPANLKRIILLMNSSSNNLRVAGFQVFKLFLVINDPPIKIKNIFTKNKERLMKLISEIDGTPKFGEVFSEEKMFVIRQLKDVDKVVPPPNNGGDNNNTTPPPPPPPATDENGNRMDSKAVNKNALDDDDGW